MREAIIANPITNATIQRVKNTEAKNGPNRTQTQSQVITPHNFKTIKTIVRSPKNPTPPLAYMRSFSLLIYISYITTPNGTHL